MGRVSREKKSYPLYYLSSGLFAKLSSGEIVVTGRGSSNELLLAYASGLKSAMPRSVWNRAIYDAGSHGTGLLQNIVPNSEFPFPKSLYVVRDALKFFVGAKQDALVLDFFAGSGTTLNAVNLLNAVDGGQRQCILVTNNEVGSTDAQSLAAGDHQPGAPEWEAKGICQLVTWPRSKYTIMGRRDDGTILTGEYLTGRTVETEKRRTFRHLAFIQPSDMRLPEGLTGRAFTKAARELVKRQKSFASLIGSLPQSLIVEPCRFVISPEHATTVLFDPAGSDEWLAELEGHDHIMEFLIVAGSDLQFNEIKAQLEGLLGPQILQEEEKRPIANGFSANLAYFKLDFLDKDQVELGAAFREILPLLWLKAGAIGPAPELTPGPLPSWFVPECNNFAVLLTETRIKPLLVALKGREGLSHFFIVTDGEEAFRALSDEVRTALGACNPNLRIVQLYRDYLVNFMINARTDGEQRSEAGVA